MVYGCGKVKGKRSVNRSYMGRWQMKMTNEWNNGTGEPEQSKEDTLLWRYTGDDWDRVRGY
jgi:hypothetical protein